MGGGSSRNKTEPRGEGVKLAFDPDEKWSNLYREREKNHLYKWVGVRKGGELINIYERDGEEGVLKFAEEKLLTILYEDGNTPKLVTYSDYIKWKKGVNVQLGLSEESVDMQQSRFKEHYALWKLNKRGVEGENLIHLLLNREQQVCYEIARILLKRFPGMANDIYLGDEQFGQSALHLAIVHDDYETVSLLLNNKADVNARACGNFFLPEDYKLTNKITDYQGYAYYGEYPLAFAACFGNKDIYDLLIQFGANPNLQDSFGNTILHMCVINYSSSMYSYAVRHWAKPADPHVVNHAGFTPLTLATKLGRKHIFEEMLEIMKVEFWRFSDMTCSAYPLNTLDTIQPDGSTNYDSALMTVINGSTPEHLDMIGSEVIQRLLADKWKAFAQRKLIERLVLLIFQLITLSIVVYIRPTELPRLYMEEPQWDDWVRTVCEILTIGNCVFFVGYQQFGEIRTQGMRGYLRNLKTAPAKAVFCIANLFLLLCIPFRLLRKHEIEEALFVFALPGSWIFLLFFARSAKLTGPFVQMIYSMIAGDMIRFAIISAIFLVSFSQVFYFVGKDMDAKQKLEDTNPHACRISGYTIYTYNTFPETFITLFRASMGGYDYEEFSCANYQALTKTLFVLYMFVMPIMMINILIAMMGNTYTTVIAQAEKAWRQQYAQIVMVLERSVGKERLAASQLEYSIRLDQEGSSGMEVRGLMVIKQTKKTRARQRKQAIYNWKTIGRKVIHTIDKVGTEQAILLLHGHDRLDRVYEDHVQPEKVPSRSRTPTRIGTTLHSSKRLKTTMVVGAAAAAAASNTHEIRTDEAVNSMLLSAPPSLSGEGGTMDWQPSITPVEERSESKSQGRSEASSPIVVIPPVHSKTPPKADSPVKVQEYSRTVRVRGADSIPSIELPNIPNKSTASTPPHRAVSPRLRADMFRRHPNTSSFDQNPPAPPSE
ncbi:CRE-OSM-9 protein [Caenorhabditis remanei]|uniref:CRE-OSM-9 protein n=1 Tax=Caenorhabditis remanei TaxID=31234 RepID=E3MRK1_CAERE|nr:CRE-OSM-9 protein [Caenorhabditis remanei]